MQFMPFLEATFSKMWQIKIWVDVENSENSGGGNVINERFVGSRKTVKTSQQTNSGQAKWHLSLITPPTDLQRSQYKGALCNC